MNLKKHLTYRRLLLLTAVIAALFFLSLIKSNSMLSDKEKAEKYLDSVQNALFQTSKDSIFIKPFEIDLFFEKMYEEEVIEDGKEKIKIRSLKDPEKIKHKLIYDVYTDIIRIPEIQFKDTLEEGLVPIMYKKNELWIHIIIDSITELKLKNLSRLHAEWKKYENQPKVPSNKPVYEKISGVLFSLLLISVVFTFIYRINSLNKK